MNLRGYTLTEIIVTIIILGVIASLGIPRLNFAIEKTRSAEGLEILQTIREAQQVYLLENGSYATLLTELDVSIPEDTIKYFDEPVLGDPANAGPVASIQRSSDPWYTLAIFEDGTITCTGATCGKLGFANGT